MKTVIKNMDDVVFEERNQNYGAYFIRRSYNKTVTRALFLAVLLFLGVISIPLIASYRNKNVNVLVSTSFDPIILKPPVIDAIKIKLPEPIIDKTVPAFKAPTVVSEPIDESIDLASLMDGVTNDSISETNDGGTLIVDEDKDKSPVDFDVLDKPMIYPEVYPTFIGGEEAMLKWLSENIKYPQIAVGTGISGTVIVSFVIEKNGSISNVQLLKDIGGGCGDEAIRVVKLMPKWKEGRQNNIPVRVSYNLPIKFTLLIQ